MLASLPLKNSISGLVLARTLLPERHHVSVINLTYMSFNILFLKRKIETEVVSLSGILGSFTVIHDISPKVPCSCHQSYVYIYEVWEFNPIFLKRKIKTEVE